MPLQRDYHSLSALEAIERGAYRTNREAGKKGIPRTVAKVLKALLNLALQHGEVRPSASLLEMALSTTANRRMESSR